MNTVNQNIELKAKEESDERNVARVGIVKTADFHPAVTGAVPVGDTNWFIRTTEKNIDGKNIKRLSLFS